MIPDRITFISHGITPGFRQALFPVNEGLEAGEEDRIRGLRWTAPRTPELWCGPELRAQETARALGLDAGADIALRDLDYGAWRGLGLDEVGAGLATWLTDVGAAPHQGESVLALMERVRRWMASRAGLGHTLAVTSPPVIRAAVVLALAAPAEAFWKVEVGPVTLTDLRLGARGWTVRSCGCGLSRTMLRDSVD